jgi:hypothetical protein
MMNHETGVVYSAGRFAPLPEEPVMASVAVNRRRFLRRTAASAVGLGALTSPRTESKEGSKMHAFICKTCGTQFAESAKPPELCPICTDERQFVGWNGQQWTTRGEMEGKYRNTINELEPGLWGIRTEPQFGIGQQAHLIRTPKGNVLWDCVTFFDEATKEEIDKLGGVSAIAISHPHFYTTLVEWSRAFRDVPVHLHGADEKWVMRPDKCVRSWTGGKKELWEGLTLINSGGHFDGFQVLHWAGGAGGKGALLSADQPMVCMDRRWVTFLYSYPNMIPLGAAAVRRIVSDLRPFAFERIYVGFQGKVVSRDGKGALERSAERYLRTIGT